MTVKEACDSLDRAAKYGTRDEIVNQLIKVNIFLLKRCEADKEEKERLKETLKNFLTKAN